MRQAVITIFLFLAVVASCGLNAQEIATSWAGGDGSQDNPYQISSIEHIFKLREDSKNGIFYENEYFVLTSDIRVYPHIEIEEFENVPIPYEEQWERIEEFNGHLNGQGHSISGLYGDKYYIYSAWNDTESCFIFKLGGSISNLIIEDSFIGCWIGLGTNENVTLNNCVNYSVTRYGFCLGDLPLMINCGNYGKSYSNALGRGRIYQAINCYNFGDVECVRFDRWHYVPDTRGSGLLNLGTKMINCMNAGHIQGSAETSGIAWSINDFWGYGLLENIVNYGQIVCTEDKPSTAIAYSVSFGQERNKLGNVYALSGSADKLSNTNLNGYDSAGEHIFVSYDTMLSDEFIRKLNENAKKADSRCCGWIRGNDGFPILEIAAAHRAAREEVQITLTVNEEEYYNLQGLRVDNPTNGLYIKVSKDGVKKVFIK